MDMPDIPTKDMIIQYVYGGHGRIIGTLVGMKAENVVTIGFSKCRRTDKFNRQTGIEIAKTRAYKLLLFMLGKKNTKPTWHIPESFDKAFEKFCERCEKYFHISTPNSLIEECTSAHGIFLQIL